MRQPPCIQKRSTREILRARCAGALRQITVVALCVWIGASDALAQDDDRTQSRPSKVRTEVPVTSILVGDGDTVIIDWGGGDEETVRILGIDTPEVRHVAHNLPFDQPFGREASAFAKGAFAAATKVEVLRADTIDRYGRTLGYLFINDRNYSEMVVRARLALESVSHFGDNGFPAEAQAVLEAARSVGPVAFEPPHQFRRRMREVIDWMRETGLLPAESE